MAATPLAPSSAPIFRAASLAAAGLMLAGLGFAFGFSIGIAEAMAACAQGLGS
jgi:hypothetical protein